MNDRTLSRPWPRAPTLMLLVGLGCVLDNPKFGEESASEATGGSLSVGGSTSTSATTTTTTTSGATGTGASESTTTSTTTSATTSTTTASTETDASTGSSCADADKIPVFPDNDMDGHGAGQPGGEAICPDVDAPPGYAKEPDDCDDGDGAIYPGAPELSDKVDNDCNGLIDEGSDGVADMFWGGCKRAALAGHFYYVCPELTNPSAAQKKCVDFAVPMSEAHAYHAKIESMEEHELIAAMLNGDTSFGLKEDQLKSVYHWVADGSPLIGFGMGGYGSYPWLSGQPDSTFEPWIVMKYDRYWGWNDAADGNARAFVCEGVPAP